MKNIFKLISLALVAGALVSCSQTDPGSSSNPSTSGDSTGVPPSNEPVAPESSLKSVDFNIVLSEALPSDFKLAVVDESNNFDFASPSLHLESTDNITFKGTLAPERGVKFDSGSIDSYDFRLTTTLGGEAGGESTTSEIFSVQVSGEKITANLENLFVPYPGSQKPYFVLDFFDKDNNNENITANEKSYVQYKDKDGNVKKAEDFALGDTVTVEYTPAVLLDGRAMVDSAFVGVNTSTQKPLSFTVKEGSTDKNPTYVATFVKEEKDARLKVYVGYEYIFSIKEDVAPYLSKVTLDNTEIAKEEYIKQTYRRVGTSIGLTVGTLPAGKVINFVGVKLNSPDSYSFDSGNQRSGATYETQLTRNDQRIEGILRDKPSENIASKAKVTYSWKPSQYTNPNSMFDGDQKGKGFDNWNDFFKADAPKELTLTWDTPFYLDHLDVFWYVQAGDAELPSHIAITYQEEGNPEWKTLNATTTNNVTNATNPTPDVKFVALKLSFNGTTTKDAWANIAEFEVFDQAGK